MSIANIGLILVVIYTLIILAICIRASKQGAANTSGKSFFLGNGTKLFVLLFTTVASTFSTWVFMGAPASTFTNGHTWIATVTLYQITMAFSCGYLGPRFWTLRQNHDFVTQADMVVEYYQSEKMRYVLGGCFIVGMLTSTIAQFRAVGLAISAMTNGSIPYWAATLYIGVIVGIYLYFGGFHGEALIDTFQGVLFSLILWGGLIVVLIHTGGLSGMFNQLTTVNPNLLLYPDGSQYYDFKMALSFCAVAIFGGIVNPGFWQRYYAAKDTKTLVKMSVWFPIMVGFGVTLSGGLVGLAANLFDLKIGAGDTVFQVLLSTISTPYWGILVTIGVIAAGMSTIAGNMNGASMIVTYDFIRMFKKNTTDKELKKYGRLVIIALLVIGYLLTLRTPSSITMLIQLMAAFNMMALYPVIGIFFWKRATAVGCLGGMVVGFATICVTNFVIKEPFGIVAGGWGLLVGMIVFVIVSLFTRPVSDEHRREFLKPLKEKKSKPQTVIE